MLPRTNLSPLLVYCHHASIPPHLRRFSFPLRLFSPFSSSPSQRNVLLQESNLPDKLDRYTFTQEQRAVRVPQARPSLQSRATSVVEHLLPKDYGSSVSEGYIDYVKWSMLASITGTVSGVLSMEALLFAMGLGAGSLPMAAALNWIIKDGLGQFGGMLCASFINQKFDADPKRWRLMAAGVLDVSVLLEVLTPLWPKSFLLMASIANVGKNIGWISASASRAAIHRSFMRAENLADITGKAGSQTIASSVVGTAIGVAISPVLGSATQVIFPVVFGLSGFHLFCVYSSLKTVTIPTLNVQRFWLAIRKALDINAVNTMAELTPSVDLELDLSKVLTPDEVSKVERVVHGGKVSGDLSVVVFENIDGSVKSDLELCIGTTVGQLSPMNLQELHQQVESHRRHYLLMDPTSDKIHLLFHQNATEHEVLKGLLHGVYAYQAVGAGRSSLQDSKLVETTLALAERESPLLIERLSSLGWDTTNLFVEVNRKRIASTSAVFK